MPTVTMYTTDWCGYCRAAKRLLAERGAAVTEIDLTHDDQGRADLVERSGRQTVPQIWIGERHVGGFDDLRALDRAGELEPLLKG